MKNGFAISLLVGLALLAFGYQPAPVAAQPSCCADPCACCQQPAPEPPCCQENAGTYHPADPAVLYAAGHRAAPTASAVAFHPVPPLASPYCTLLTAAGPDPPLAACPLFLRSHNLRR